MIFSCLTLMLYHHQPPLTRLHPWKSKWNLKITFLQRKSQFKLCSIIFRICILQNPEKSAEICKESEWSRLFWRHCSCCFRRKWAAEGGHELRWWHPTALGAMPTKTDEGRNLAILTVHPPKFNMEPGIFFGFQVRNLLFQGAPIFSWTICVLGGCFFKHRWHRTPDILVYKDPWGTHTF